MDGLAAIRGRAEADRGGDAALDAIVMPEWERRYYSYDASWGEAEELAAKRDGFGNEYSVVFASGGAFIHGFDHESELSPWQSAPPSLHP